MKMLDENSEGLGTQGRIAGRHQPQETQPTRSLAFDSIVVPPQDTLVSDNGKFSAFKERYTPTATHRAPNSHEVGQNRTELRTKDWRSITLLINSLKKSKAKERTHFSRGRAGLRRGLGTSAREASSLGAPNWLDTKTGLHRDPQRYRVSESSQPSLRFC